MSKYFIYSREENGYHDSYFYDVFYNSESNQIEEVMTHATAWAGMNKEMPVYSLMTEEVSKKIKKCMVKESFQRSQERAENRTNFQVGESVKAKRSFKHKGKSYPQGLEGEVFWSGRFKKSQEYAQVGIKTAEGTIFTSAKNLSHRASNLEMLKAAIRGVNEWMKSNQKAG